jgi:hypothetical protein
MSADCHRRENALSADATRGKSRIAPRWAACCWVLSFLLALLLSVHSLPACSVPVFRYALEKWAADEYQAIVFHRGPLTAAQQALMQPLTGEGLAGQLPANVALQTVDLAQNPDPALLALWRQLGSDTLPALILKYPQKSRLSDHLFAGPLTAAAVQQVLDSPARREIIRRIAQGQSVVWVLLETGDATRDEAAAKVAAQRLDYLTTVLKLPAIEPQDIASGLVSVPKDGLKLAFSVLRMNRKDAAESVFARMLLHSEPDLLDLQEPMLFPVFGRGRALYALAGKGINHETLDEAATFLTGKCSCEVKELNPGVDLLLTADWAGLIKAQSEGARPAVLQQQAAAAAAAPETVTITGDSAPPPTPGNRPLIPAAAGALAALLLAGFFWWRRN